MMKNWQLMYNFRFAALILLVLGCKGPANYQLHNVTQLSFEGDNGEAYFNTDDSKVVFQSKRNNNECDSMKSTGLLNIQF